MFTFELLNQIMEQQNPVPNQLNIEISEEVAEGTYSNLVIITHYPTRGVISSILPM